MKWEITTAIQMLKKIIREYYIQQCTHKFDNLGEMKNTNYLKNTKCHTQKI